MKVVKKFTKKTTKTRRPSSLHARRNINADKCRLLTNARGKKTMVNPLTGRTIRVGGPTHVQLLRTCLSKGYRGTSTQNFINLGWGGKLMQKKRINNQWSAYAKKHGLKQTNNKQYFQRKQTNNNRLKFLKSL